MCSLVLHKLHQMHKTSIARELKTTESCICNICRQGEEDGPLISPCDCKGSMGHVHYECLKMWIETSCTSTCHACKKEYHHPTLVINKAVGQFDTFFHESEIGARFSQFMFYFFIIFFMVYFSCFHCRLQHHLKANSIGLGVTITILNSIFFILHAGIFLIYLCLLRLSFIHWRADHFSIHISKRDP